MLENENYLKNAELSTEQNANMIDGILNNRPLATPAPIPAIKPLDRVMEPPKKNRSRDREER